MTYICTCTCNYSYIPDVVNPLLFADVLESLIMLKGGGEDKEMKWEKEV